MVSKRRIESRGQSSVQRLRDKALSERALEKLKRSEVPTAQEAAALDRYKVQADLEKLAALVAGVPKGIYAGWVGRQHKVLNEQAERHGLPIGKGHATIDVPEVLKRFHDLLAENRWGVADGSEMDAAKLRQVQESVRKLELQNEALARESIRSSYVQEMLELLTGQLRNLGENLSRQIEGEPGVKAHDMLQGCLDAIELEIAERFASDQVDKDLHADEQDEPQ